MALVPKWNRIFESPEEGITALVVQAISTIILCSSLIHFMLFSVVAKQDLQRKQQTRSVINILCILCLVFSILYCLSNIIIQSIVTFVMDINCKYRSWTLCFLLSQRLCLYWFYIQRLKITFEHSLLPIRTTCIKILYFSSSLTITISAIIAYYLDTVSGCEDSTQILSYLPAVVFDIFWCLFLSIYFVLKLRQSIVEFQNAEHRINQNMVVLMCKLTNIIIWSSLVLQVSQWSIGFFSGWLTSCVTLNVLILSIALLFTFRPYSKLYETYVCCLCHQCIIKWCRIKLAKHLIRSSIQFKYQQKQLQMPLIDH